MPLHQACSKGAPPVDPRIAQLLSGELDPSTLSLDELRSLRGELEAAFTAADPGEGVPPSAEQIDELRRITDATDRVQVAIAGHVESEQRAAAAGDLRRRISSLPPVPEPRTAEPQVDAPAAHRKLHSVHSPTPEKELTRCG